MKTAIKATDAGKEITVGMHLTLSIGSDRYAYEVATVIDGKTIEIRRLGSTVVKSDGCGNGEREYFSNPGGPTKLLRKVVRGGRDRWLPARKAETGRGFEVSDGYYLSFGTACEYMDPQF